MGYWVPLANAARRGVLPRLTAAARTLCVDTTALRQIWRRSGRRGVGSRGTFGQCQKASRDVRRRDVYRGALRVAPDVRDVLHCALRDVLHCAAHAVVQLQFPRSSPLRRYPKRSRTQCVQRVGARDKSKVTVASYHSDSQDEKRGSREFGRSLRPNAEPWAPAGARPRTIRVSCWVLAAR